MEGLGLLGSQLPPGFRFHPTDQELIIHYLMKRVMSSLTPAASIIAEIDLYKFNPWELPDKAFFGESEWFFFTPRDRKYPNGSRPNRGAASGYWKATGTDKPIIAAGGSKCLGVKKALVFYQGRPPKGTKTDWVMQEYRLLDGNSSSWQHKPNSMRLDDWVLCRVRQRGIIPNEADEKQEASVLTNPSSFNSTGKAAQPKNLMTNKNPQSSQGERETFTESKKSINEWSDYQLLAYLMGSQEEGGESTSGVLDPANSFSQDSSVGSWEYGTDLTQPPQQVSSMLDSIKRTLSFGAMDELMLQPPSKRLHYTSICEQSSQPSSFSAVDQLYPQFII